MRESMVLICPTEQASVRAADWRDGQFAHGGCAGGGGQQASANALRSPDTKPEDCPRTANVASDRTFSSVANDRRFSPNPDISWVKADKKHKQLKHIYFIQDL
jgi:hypothetical protein